MANPDLDITPSSIHAVTQKLNTQAATTKGALVALQGIVGQLLTPEGGLWLRQSSPQLEGTYQEFNGQLTLAIESINSFAENFNQIAKNMEDLDLQILKGTQNSGGGGS